MLIVGQYGLYNQLFISIDLSGPKSFDSILCMQSDIVLLHTVLVEKSSLFDLGFETWQGSNVAFTLGTTQIGAIGVSYDSK